MSTRSNISLLIALIIIITTAFTLNPEKRIIENIKVEEWIVPIYAVDSRGNSVTDLKNNDIELYVNDHKFAHFNFIRRRFLTENNQKPEWFKNKKEEKIVVLVFDTALSKSPSIMKSKAIADQLVSRSNNDTKFIIFKIEGFQGLSYLGGPTNNKSRIKSIIKKKIIGRDNKRSVSSGVDDSESEKSKYQHDEQVFFLLQQTKYLSDKSSQFASSFQSLYYAITNITGTKFIYLFSEGISNSSWARGDTHASKMAGYLLRSGAVLFLINPSGGRGSSLESGEEFLQVLSSLSGGKYLTGDTKSINNKIANIHNAYYELSFQSPDDMKGGMLRIDVRSKRKNVNIHTIRNLEKSKGYLGLDNFEKKLTVLNMISKNPIFKLPVEVEDAKILREETSGQETIYHISIPEHFLNHNADFFRIQMPGTGKKPIVTKSVVKLTKSVMKTGIENKDGFNNYFALVNYELGMALIKGVGKEVVRINSASLKKGILEFTIDRFKLKTMKEKKVGLLRIAIKIINLNGEEIKSDEKEITLVKENTTLRIPVKQIPHKKYNILIIVKDMVSGDETNETLEVNI
ncbi:MAG: hypothetical protein KAS21_06720 [Candidatus Aminicenantes bacterium]|nr:hypothetical protein [Candidatus Aminicenantes bacterium]